MPKFIGLLLLGAAVFAWAQESSPSFPSDPGALLVAASAPVAHSQPAGLSPQEQQRLAELQAQLRANQDAQQNATPAQRAALQHEAANLSKEIAPLLQRAGSYR